ncbi:DUF58 domain-containing protein [Nigerium massiliense]|uniref:DUF58 domain-containing protein n=1 Tax=Nigerium massiliense TaxID=1522317 RepID=UPI00058B884E|nr:DUF58 domain-containing protein [Nigerium massiliense]
MLTAPTPVLVTPQALPLPPSPQRATGMSGETPIPQTAVSGPDDVLVREYQPLDDVRRVHWPSTARAGQLMVRREEQAWDPAAWLVLDSRSSSHGGARATSASFEWLVTLAASVGVRLIDDGYVVSITDVDSTTHSSRGREHLQPRQAWLEHLVDAVLTPQVSLGPATRILAQQQSGAVVLALLGSLSVDDAAHLVETADAGRGRVILLERDDDSRAQADARQILSAHGWAVATARPDSDPAAAWAALRAASAVVDR